jgi:hypothetical protein
MDVFVNVSSFFFFFSYFSRLIADSLTTQLCRFFPSLILIQLMFDDVDDDDDNDEEKEKRLC